MKVRINFQCASKNHQYAFYISKFLNTITCKLVCISAVTIAVYSMIFDSHVRSEHIFSLNVTPTHTVVLRHFDRVSSTNETLLYLRVYLETSLSSLSKRRRTLFYQNIVVSHLSSCAIKNTVNKSGLFSS